MEINELGLEKHILEDFISLKTAYADGREEFIKTYHELPPAILLELSHTGGMASMYKEKGELLNFSIQQFKIVERIFSELFDCAQLSKENKIKRYGLILKKIKWFKHLDAKEYVFYSSVDNLELSMRSDDSLKVTFQKGEPIGKTTPNFWSPTKDKVFIRTSHGKLLVCENFKKHTDYKIITQDGHKANRFKSFQTRLYESLMESNKSGSTIRLNIAQQEFLFKNMIYFNGHPNSLSEFAQEVNSENKIYLNAFIFMRYFRNLASHNTLDNDTLENKYHKVSKGDNAEHKYLKDPELILSTNYFEQFTNMILLGYIKFLPELV